MEREASKRAVTRRGGEDEGCFEIAGLGGDVALGGNGEGLRLRGGAAEGDGEIFGEGEVPNFKGSADFVGRLFEDLQRVGLAGVFEGFDGVGGLGFDGDPEAADGLLAVGFGF
jgi:hypothetical protein